MTKEELYDYYIVKNHTLQETMNYFKMSRTCLCGKIKKYGMSKPKTLSSKNISARQNKVVIDKDVLIDLYIAQNFTLEETSKQLRCSKKSVIRRLAEYGIKKNVDKRYGVPYACMRKECRQYSGNNSKPNQHFTELLTKNGIDFEKNSLLVVIHTILG